jgi:hypothetical protein
VTNRWLRFGALLVVMCLTSSCTTTSSVKDGTSLQPDEGLLVMHVTTNATSGLDYVDFSPTSTAGSRWVEYMVGPKGAIRFSDGDSFWAVPIKEGDYMWSKFHAGNYFANIQSSNRFKVARGTITYIGDLHIEVEGARFGLKVRNNPDRIRDYLQLHYPSYTKSMPFHTSLTEIRW